MNTTEPFRPEERQTAEAPLLTGSQALIESFLREGVETVFGYPGGAIIPVYDALYDYRDRLRHILVRHEQGAVHAAQGYARVSGRVGVCLVTSGPGATNTVTGLACWEPTPFRRPTSSGSRRPSRNGTARSNTPKRFRRPSPKPSISPVRGARAPSWSTSPRTPNARRRPSATNGSPRSAATHPPLHPTQDASRKRRGSSTKPGGRWR